MIAMVKLTSRIKELAASLGAADVGIVTQKLLEGGPPSKDSPPQG